MLSWIRYIIDQKAYDEPFVKYWTNLPFLINPRDAPGLPRRGGLARLREPGRRSGRCLRYASHVCDSARIHPALSFAPGCGDGEQKGERKRG